MLFSFCSWIWEFYGMKTSAFWEMHSSHAATFFCDSSAWFLESCSSNPLQNLPNNTETSIKICQTMAIHELHPFPNWLGHHPVDFRVQSSKPPNLQTSNFQTVDFPWRIIAMQPNEIWLLARWATRIDELARSLRAAFSLQASSRVTGLGVGTLMGGFFFAKKGGKWRF